MVKPLYTNEVSSDKILVEINQDSIEALQNYLRKEVWHQVRL